MARDVATRGRTAHALYASQLLTVTELDALVEALRVRLDAQQWPSFPLTFQLLDNALEGSVLPSQAAGVTRNHAAAVRGF